MKHMMGMLVSVAIGSLCLNAQQAVAQMTITPENTLSTTITQSADRAGQLNRAKNLARQAAERMNGGLTYYRAENAMHGPAAEAPFVDNGNGTVTFTFVGGAPARTPTVQTVATVNLASGNVAIDYNGPIRQ